MVPTRSLDDWPASSAAVNAWYSGSLATSQRKQTRPTHVREGLVGPDHERLDARKGALTIITLGD